MRIKLYYSTKENALKKKQKCNFVSMYLITAINFFPPQKKKFSFFLFRFFPQQQFKTKIQMPTMTLVRLANRV